MRWEGSDVSQLDQEGVRCSVWLAFIGDVKIDAGGRR